MESRDKDMMENSRMQGLTTISSSIQYITLERSPSTLSRTSSFRSITSNKDSTQSSSVLGNKKFAPPPPFPTSLQVTKMKLWGKTDQVKTTLPSYSDVKHSGEVLARFSKKSRLTKRWRSTFWIVHGKNRILFFRCVQDFDEWAANPYLSTSERNGLVKLALDFKNDGYKPGHTMDGYRIYPIKSKYIKEGRTKRMVSNFRLDKWTTKRSSIVLALGGRNAGDVGALHKIMTEIAKNAGNKVAPKELEEYNDDGMESDFGSIGFSFSNLSTGSMLDRGNSFDERDDSSFASRGRSRRNSEGSLGSKIMTRMRSRSPMTRARRMKEIQDEQSADSYYSQMGVSRIDPGNCPLPPTINSHQYPAPARVNRPPLIPTLSTRSSLTKPFE